MKWLRQLIEKIFCRNKIKLLSEPKQSINTKNVVNEFFIDIKRKAEVEQDDGNGYKIIQNIRLEDMV